MLAWRMARTFLKSSWDALPLCMGFLSLGTLLLSAGPRLIHEWTVNPNAEHVMLTLPVGALVLASRLGELRRGARDGPFLTAALPLLALGLCCLFLDAALGEPFLLACGLWCGGLGTTALFCGRKGLRAALFPFVLLAFAIPAPQALARNLLHLHLQRAAAAVTGGVLALGGLTAHTTGTLVNVGGKALTVAEQCSGLKFLTTLSFGALVTGWMLLPGRLFAKVLLAASALPVAFAVNVMRLCIAAVVLQSSGTKAMNIFLHEGWAVMLLYALGIAMLVGLAILLRGIGTSQVVTILHGKQRP